MEDLEAYKNERRRILGTLQSWNIGITPHGNLATESCFVHNSVPDIVFKNNKATIIESTYISTKSEWATNLVQSSASNPCDTETIKSLSVCSSIFHPEPSTEYKTNTLHLIKHSIKAYVIVDNIARLTKEFDDELSKAEEHWPHSPQKSWDKLCLIWNRYGFLWPKRVQIGFKIHESFENGIDDRLITVEYIKNHLEKKSQGILHSPKKYSVIWRTNLKPMHEFFPEKYYKKRNFINQVIYRFSTLVFADSLFRLKNVKSGDYLGRQNFLETSSSPLDSSFEITAVPSSDDKNNSNIFWKFIYDSTPNITEQPSLPYVFVRDEIFLCPGQCDTILSKFQQQQSSFDKTSILQSRSNIKLISYNQPRDGTSNSLDENNKWSIGMLDTIAPSVNKTTKDTFNLDTAINNTRCLIHGDKITLNQHSLYLRTTASNYLSSYQSGSINNNSPLYQGTITKSPMSVTSFGDQCNFSSGERLDSNSTQPTSGSNSVYNPTPSNNYKKYANSRGINQSPQTAFIERSSQRDKVNLSAEYLWKIETLPTTKSIEEKQEDEIVKVAKNLSIKRDISDNDQIARNPKPYSPKLNIDIMRCSTADTNIDDDDKNQVLIASSSNNNVRISSMVPSQSYYEQTREVLNQQQQLLQQKRSPQQRSKWLDVNPKLYNLQIDSDEIDNIQQSIRSSQYNTPMGSIRSATSSIGSLLEVSDKKLGKQPLQNHPTTNFQNRNNYSSSDSDNWSSSRSPSPTDRNDNIDLNIATITSTTPALTEAEDFKRGIQKTYKEQQQDNNVHNIILKNIFSASPRSNTTSQIRYYDDDDDVGQGSSSQLRTYTMTPRSRYSQPTPSSSANLTPEEYIKRRRSRENSFMLLLNKETKQQLWLRAIKQSSLSHWIHLLSTNTKKLQMAAQHQKSLSMIICSKLSSNNNSSSNFLNSDIRFRHNNSHNNRKIHKKKGFYYKTNGNRRQSGIAI